MNTETEVSLKVVGMTCGSCVRHVTHALSNVAGVSDVKVDLGRGVATVRYRTGHLSDAALVAAVRKAGYDGSLGA